MTRTLITALLLLSLTACKQHDEQSRDPQPRVEGDTITFPAGAHEPENIQSREVQPQAAPATRLNGRLTWDEDRTVRIYTPFAGRVERILAQPGQAVRKGQALAVIASPEFGQAQTDADRAKSDFALAEKNLARLRELEQHGVAARKELQTTQADYERARGEFQRTQRRLAMYGGSRDRIDQTYTLSSPITGAVVEKNINPGQELRPDQMISNAPPLYVITDPTTLWAQIDATEKDLGKIRKGKTITIRTPAYRDESFPAKITAISDFLDPGTRTLKVRALLDNAQRKLKGEMFVTAEIDADHEMVLLVPSKSVFFLGGQHYVFIDEGGGKFSRRKVMTDDVYGEQMEIAKGLSGGEKVVTLGSLMLQQIMKPQRVQK